MERLKELERANGRLKRFVADQALDIQILKEVANGNSEPGPTASGHQIRHSSFLITQRRACRVIGQHRSVQRRKLVENTYRTRLATCSRALSRKNPRCGWRYMQDLLSREGWRVNHKPLCNVCQEEGLKAPQILRKKSEN